MKAVQAMYTMASMGTRKPISTELWSETSPMRGGRIAPPTMAVTIRPESSLVNWGMDSTVMEKASGKMVILQCPTTKKLATATEGFGTKRTARARMESNEVT